MIRAAVLAPHPPLLFRELGGRVDPVAALRAACHEALAEALAQGPERVVVVGGAQEARSWAGQPPVRRFGTTGPRTDEEELPLSLGVGRRLLDEVGWTGATELQSLVWDADDHALEQLAGGLAGSDAVVLLLGDGSARRGELAPGYLDERSFSFDAATAQALARGDAAALLRLDVGLAGELLVQGSTAFRMLGALGFPETARLVYDDDPFGVAYHVALWHYSGRA